VSAQGRPGNDCYLSAKRDRRSSGRARWPSIVVAAAAFALCANAGAQPKELYRYTDADGKVVYTDKPPPPDAKNVQPKRMGENVIDTSELPLAARMASERYPVTLYTFDCGEPCQNAVALLNKRGIPFRTVNVSETAGGAKLMKLTGTNLAPVLQVGESLVSQGMNDERWQAMLDQAGYPRTPPPRRMAPGKGTETPPDAKTAASTATPPAPASASTASQSPAAATGDGGYPK